MSSKTRRKKSPFNTFHMDFSQHNSNMRRTKMNNVRARQFMIADMAQTTRVSTFFILFICCSIGSRINFVWNRHCDSFSSSINFQFQCDPDANATRMLNDINQSYEWKSIIFHIEWAARTYTRASLEYWFPSHTISYFISFPMQFKSNARQQKKKTPKIQLVSQSLYSAHDVSYSICCQNHAPCQPKWFTTPSPATRHTRHGQTNTCARLPQSLVIYIIPLENIWSTEAGWADGEQPIFFTSKSVS